MARKVRYQRDKTLTRKLSRRSALEGVSLVWWVVGFALIVLLGWLAWRSFFDQRLGDPVDGAMFAVESQDRLTVFSSRFEVPVRTGGGAEPSLVPAQVIYEIDMSSMDRGDFYWNAESETLTVTLPAIEVGEPAFGAAAPDLTADQMRSARRNAAELAAGPEALGLARSAAEQVMRQDLAAPLRVAGYPDASVAVRFEDRR